LGVTLYEMISGQRPFGGPTVSDTIAALLLSEPKRLSQHLPNVPAELESVIARMLAKDRDARYWSAQEVLTDLKRVKDRCELASDVGATSPIDHSACYETNIAMISEFQTPSPIGPESKDPSQPGPELKIPPPAGPELNTPSQPSYETDII